MGKKKKTTVFKIQFTFWGRLPPRSPSIFYAENKWCAPRSVQRISVPRSRRAVALAPHRRAEPSRAKAAARDGIPVFATY